MYTDNSENLIPGVNQFPHTHSAETETHIHFCPKSVETFDLRGFSRQQSHCLHMDRISKLVNRLYFHNLISTLR